MGNVVCCYRTDAEGNLVRYNACPVAVEELYQIKEAISRLDKVDVRLENLICELEYNLFKDQGVSWNTWYQKNSERITEDVKKIFGEEIAYDEVRKEVMIKLFTFDALFVEL